MKRIALAGLIWLSFVGNGFANVDVIERYTMDYRSFFNQKTGCVTIIWHSAEKSGLVEIKCPSICSF